MGIVLQDSWKITHKFTLDYGLRWDLQHPHRELHGRKASFSPTLQNPNANGSARRRNLCGVRRRALQLPACAIYPYAIAPRFGGAYQIDGKTVIRAGWGFSYGPLVALLTRRFHPARVSIP